jgi:hypothetical protein
LWPRPRPSRMIWRDVCRALTAPGLPVRAIQRRTCPDPRRLHMSVIHRAIRERVLLPAFRMGGPARRPAFPATEGPSHLPPGPCLPATAHGRHPSHRAHPCQRPRLECALRAAADGHPRAPVPKPDDARDRAERRRCQYHDCIGCTLVHDRHDLHGGLRRPVPSDQPREAVRRRDHHRRCRHLRHVHRLPGGRVQT